MIYDHYDGTPYDNGYGNFGAPPYYGVPPYYGTLPYAGVSPIYMGSQYGSTGLYGPYGTSPSGYNQPYAPPYADPKNISYVSPTAYNSTPYGAVPYANNAFPEVTSPYGYAAPAAGDGVGYGGWGGGYGWGGILLALALAAAVAFYFYRRGFFSW